MEMFGLGTSLRAMVNRKAAARWSRAIERVVFDLPEHVRADMGREQKPRYFVPRMLGE